MACPSVDKYIKSRLNAHAKAKDKSLAKHQALMLDAVGPISTILEEAAKGMLSIKTATEAAQTALMFLGNASMQINRERRRIAIEAMNPSLTDLAEGDKAFGKAAPLLFGEGFAKKAKERDEELKCVNQASKQQPASQRIFKPGQNSVFFEGAALKLTPIVGAATSTKGDEGTDTTHTQRDQAQPQRPNSNNEHCTHSKDYNFDCGYRPANSFQCLNTKELFIKPYTITNIACHSKDGSLSNGTKSCNDITQYSREVGLILQKLGMHHHRPLGKRLYKGVCNRLDTTTIPSNTSRGNSLLPSEDTQSEYGGSKDVEQACHSNGSTPANKQGFPLPAVCCPKEGWWSETYHQSKKIELFCGSCTLQNGGQIHVHAQGPPKRRGLDDKDRSKRCLFHDPHCTPSQTVTPFQMERADINSIACHSACHPLHGSLPDPYAMATDAFTLNWADFRGYASPPWNMITRVLTQTRAQQARLVLVAPIWRAQPWYSTLLEMLVHRPVLLPNKPDLVQPTHRVNHVNHPDITPRLAGWTISGIDSEAKNFQKALQPYCLHHGDTKLPKVTTPCVARGLAGVVKGVQIPFQEI